MLPWLLGSSYLLKILFFSKSTSRYRIVGSQCSFLENLHNVLPSGCTDLHSHRQCRRIPFSSNPLQNLLLWIFDVAILISVRWYCIVHLICLFQRTGDAEHLFMCFMTISMTSLEKYAFRSLIDFYWVFCFLQLSRSNGLLAPKSLQMVTRAMKLKDACFLEESYDQPRQHIKKQRYYFDIKGPSSQSYGFSSNHVWMWEVDYKESWGPKNGCFWTVMLEETLESLGLQGDPTCPS